MTTFGRDRELDRDPELDRLILAYLTEVRPYKGVLSVRSLSGTHVDGALTRASHWPDLFRALDARTSSYVYTFPEAGGELSRTATFSADHATQSIHYTIH